MTLSAAELGRKWFARVDRGFTDGAPQPRHWKSYGVALIQCAAGDGELHPKEKEYILGYCATFGADDEVIKFLDNYQPEADFDPAKYYEKMQHDLPVMKHAPNYLIFDALSASYADGDLATEEINVVRKFAKALNVSDDEFEIILNLVKTEKERLKEKHAILNRGTNFSVLFNK
eukprot:TRINITY_DN17739_c0_g1_i1.p1 TRINITY_DN17739_c0_g1~~TRINITY_DN17739_c0_g1_i1.p1  ORF type:complete len:174 (+),score=32.59 TRINITY_DN17739_c0_g1_i1:23-544(+)